MGGIPTKCGYSDIARGILRSDMGTLLDDARQFLRQQRAMYGDTLYVDRVQTDAVTLHAPEDAVAPAMTKDPEVDVATRTTRVQAAWQDASTMHDLHAQIRDCLQCPLGHERTNIVVGSGNVHADLMVVGEAPGADEDAQGLPFVGRAGQLLTKVLESVQFTREEVYICNILKCRPPNNRKPLVAETDECEPYLWKQIELVQPRFILALGLTAANTLLKNKDSMTSLRQKVHDYHGIPMIVTYHPAALLRNPEWKVHTWEDVKMLRRLYDQHA